MGFAFEARDKARERMGVPLPPREDYADADGIHRVATRASRADTTPSGEYCGECGLEFDLGYRPDPCIGGYLPGVAHACCGHGSPRQAYVSGGAACVPDQAANTIRGEWCVRGRAALDYIEAHRHLATPDT